MAKKKEFCYRCGQCVGKISLIHQTFPVSSKCATVF